MPHAPTMSNAFPHSSPSTPTYWQMSISEAQVEAQQQKKKQNLYKLQTADKARREGSGRRAGSVQKIIFTPLTYEISLYNCNSRPGGSRPEGSRQKLPATLTYINTLSHKSQFSDAWNEQTEGIHFPCVRVCLCVCVWGLPDGGSSSK